MDIFLQDPSEVPLPPEDVRIREFKATPWPDGRRVHVYLEVDPFQKRPNAEVVILTQDSQTVAEASIIETMTRKMEFNLHLRQPELTGSYQVQVTLYYPAPAASGGEAAAEQPANLERLVVDAAQAEFTIG
jgi:hypothetical protein